MSQGPTPPRPAVVVAALLVVTLAAAALAATVTGAAAPLVAFDPGPLVRWGIPILKVVNDLAVSLTIGSLLLAAVALPVGARDGAAAHPRPLAAAPALLVATVAASVWMFAVVLLIPFTVADGFGVGFDDPTFGAQVWQFATEVSLGQQLLVSAVVAGLVALFAAAASTLRAAGLLTLLSLVGLVPPALAGHSALNGGSDHETAVTSLGLHLLGVSVWVGGLAALALLWRAIPDDARPVTVARYSTLAGWAFAVVAASGAINAWIRIGSLSGLASSYGALLLAKTAALVILGIAGLRHRRACLPALEGGRPRAFLRLAGVEVLVMGVAVGVAAALARSAPPTSGAPEPAATLARSLTGYDLPPPPTLARWLTSWQPDLLWLTLALLGAGLYVVGVRRLSHRGDSWPLHRTLLWFAGLGVLVWVTSSGPAVYGRVLFSAHMLGHMTISMLVPLLLVGAAPVTLALRTLPVRHDGSRGPREWLLAVIESRYLRVLAQPVVAAALFAFSLVIFYYSPLFPLALTTHVGHELMHLHFLFAGYLFLWVLIGADPGPARPSPPMRLVLLLATMAFHAFFGVGLLMGRTVLAPEYFGGLGRTWGGSLLEDQQFGGGLAWGIGDLPTLVLAVIIAIQWARADEREARRRDRAADRDGGAELAAYNEMLARMAGRERE